ncbi:MarR family transcriptional regulator [Nocardioides panacis]|uniref:MarR family transcriptional regulator n=1 Tax=Nocardioides panacis TaxID=2849501 RepID=A0A975T1H7_9ACTN|nr:MarR family transcriptional regulator [Nocardioides panacis]QWZ09869.1 MarR family transcriptional regulator [Nocardioides panacis]
MSRTSRTSPANSGELADAFLTASRALAGLAVRSLNAAPVEVTLPQHRLLVLLSTGGEQTVGALAQQFEVNPSNASRLCDRLQRLGLVSRDRSARDGRAVDVALTAAGRELLETVRAHRRHEIQRVLDGMSHVDVGAAVQALTAFGDAAHELGEAQWTVHAS